MRAELRLVVLPVRDSGLLVTSRTMLTPELRAASMFSAELLGDCGESIAADAAIGDLRCNVPPDGAHHLSRITGAAASCRCWLSDLFWQAAGGPLRRHQDADNRMPGTRAAKRSARPDMAVEGDGAGALAASGAVSGTNGHYCQVPWPVLLIVMRSPGLILLAWPLRQISFLSRRSASARAPPRLVTRSSTLLWRSP